MFSALAHSLDKNRLTNVGNDMSGILKLAEALPHSQLTSLSLANNALCGVNEYGNGTYTIEGIKGLCEALTSSTTLTSLNLQKNGLRPDAKRAMEAAAESRAQAQLESAAAVADERSADLGRQTGNMVPDAMSEALAKAEERLRQAKRDEALRKALAALQLKLD